MLDNKTSNKLHQFYEDSLEDSKTTFQPDEYSIKLLEERISYETHVRIGGDIPRGQNRAPQSSEPSLFDRID